MPRLVWVALVAALVVAIGLVGVPIFLLWPFRTQGPNDVYWAWTLRREWAPAGTAACAMLVVFALYVGWKRTKWPGRTGLLVMTLVTLGTAWFSHQNHFEWMFTPVAEPA